ncbi:hypothetical protein EBI_26240 [Enterocytozoon bieneusi H348]|nr:hypothetical protein EBI_26240 [Enterocytozoon bieneusi H348]|eukprot:XP_002651223.1 hypothetical protein EBI_26240 [Enterocytozoon bieneusi H348]
MKSGKKPKKNPRTPPKIVIPPFKERTFPFIPGFFSINFL